MSAAHSKKLVWVVEDDAATRTLIGKALEATGYDVLEAADGLAASESLGQLARLPDLLLCDVMMPTIDGFSLVRLIRRHAELRSIPIIFLTARTNASDVVRGIQLGARSYIQKPFKISDLLTKIEAVIR